MLESGASPEELCRLEPEHLDAVRARWRELRAIETELDELFATSQEDQRLPRIEGYAVRAVLGSGGMGIVYAARHEKLGRDVALKMLLAGTRAGAEAATRFHREAEAAARLRHPHVVPIFDIGDCEGAPYFTMELVEGGSLAQQLARELPSVERAVEIAIALADAVQLAHEHGIVHRDLKPANVLLDREGVPKITDFGLARLLDEDERLTRSGAPLGTPSYMAPEQSRGVAGAAAPSVDIYALGAVLHELLTGRPPFRGTTPTETLRLALEVEPERPSRSRPEVSRDLDIICLKCLEKDPLRRYASARELADDLRRFRDGQPIRARALGLGERAMRWARRHRLGAVLVLSALVTLTLLATLGLREWSAARERDRTLASEVARLDAVRELQRSGRLSEARAILAQVKLASASPLQARRERLHADLVLEERLSSLRLARGHSPRLDRFDEKTDRAYEQTLREAGLGSLEDAPTEIAARIATSAARRALIEALDDWMLCIRDRSRLARLLAIARCVDPEPWRDRLRDPAGWSERARLEALAADPSCATQPVPLLLVLAGLLHDAGGDGTGFLRRVQKQHADDYWVNFTFAEMLGNDDEAIEYHRAALALRPKEHAAYVNIAVALSERGRLEEATDYWRRAVELTPDATHARLDLAQALFRVRRFEEAREEAEEVLQREPANAKAHHVFAAALVGLGEYAEAARFLDRGLRGVLANDASADELRRVGAVYARMHFLERRLATISDEAGASASGLDLLELAKFAAVTERPALALQLFQRAFAREPELGTDLDAGHRMEAAHLAIAIASASPIENAPDDAGRAEARAMARLWLAAEREAYAAALSNSDPNLRVRVMQLLERLVEGAELASWRSERAWPGEPLRELEQRRTLLGELAEMLDAERGRD
ncbi:MAG: protein kinase [Planctomycetes bacterium]|nr:protein kinase [Planctomycetota bacterium]